MKQRLIETVSRDTRLRVVNALKRTPSGLAVRDLAGKLGMSYMGVKDLCKDLHTRGLLDTWRQPGKLGRPRMLYRLTPRAHDLFPASSDALTLELLDAAKTLWGGTAPEKLLHVTFQRRAEHYESRITATLPPERARQLAILRDQLGYMAVYESSEAEPLRIVEHHSPELGVLRAYPLLGRLEAELFTRILRVPMARQEASTAGLFCATFTSSSRQA